MRIALIGMGRMGRMIRDCAADRGIEVAAEFNTATIAQLAQCDRMDAVIDFSAPCHQCYCLIKCFTLCLW